MAFADRAKQFLNNLGWIENETLESEDDREEPAETEEEIETDADSKGVFSRIIAFFRPGDDTDYDDSEEDPGASNSKPGSNGASSVQAPNAVPGRYNNIIHDERLTARTQNQSARQPHREHILSVFQIDECKGIIEYLSQGETVLICLENVDPKTCGRIVDLLSGAAFALQGHMVKIGHLCYLLAPQSVEVITEKDRTNRKS